MALAISALTSEGFTTDGTSFTTAASVSPAASCGLILCIDESSATLTGDPTITTGFTIDGSWTQELAQTESGHRLLIYSAYASSSPGSGTVQIDWGATRTGMILGLVQVTGQHASDFVLQPAIELSPTGDATNKSLAGALGSADNAILSIFAMNLNEVCTAAGGETEIIDVGHAAPNRRLHVIYQVNDTNGSHDWTNSANQGIQAVMELAVASSSPQTITPSGVASEEAIGTPTFALVRSFSPAGVASEEAVGSPTFALLYTLVVSGVASEEAIGVPTFAMGVFVLVLSGVPSEEAIGVVTIIGGEAPAAGPGQLSYGKFHKISAFYKRLVDQ